MMDMSMGEKIKNRRKSLGMTQDDLAAKCGTTKQAICKYEKNVVKNIPYDKLGLIADSLGVGVANLTPWNQKEILEHVESKEYILPVLDGAIKIRIDSDKRRAAITMPRGWVSIMQIGGREV